MTPAYALKFISGKYQGGEFPLVPGRDVVVGRSAELDMVLVEDMVSRKHARLSTDGDQIIITDLGSTNGTFVNGEKVRQARLQEGDRVLIGTSILKLVVSGQAQLQTEQARQELQARGQREQRSSTMSGTIEEVPIPDLLQLFSTSKRTGVLDVRRGGEVGKIYLRDGAIFYALINEDHDLGPMKALCRMVGWETGEFEFGHLEDGAEFMLELEESTESLLMEAMRQLDEYRRVAEELPALNEHLKIPAPLSAALSQLKPYQLDIFQLVMNERVAQRVFDKAPGTDYQTATALLSLLRGGYVKR